MPLRPFPTQANLTLDHLPVEVEGEQRCHFFEIDNDVPNSPYHDPMVHLKDFVTQGRHTID